MKPSKLWLLPPQNLYLADEEVHIWRGFLDLPESLIHNFMKLLSEDELIRANRFYFSKDKDRYIAARSMLRKILSFYLDIEPNAVRFRYSQHGKPSLHPDMDGLKLPIQTSNLKFNLSHSNSIALVGITLNRQIGVDVEYTKHLPDADEIAGRFFSSQENLIYQELKQAQKQTAFYRCWTRKEAFIKAIGEGLSFPLGQFAVNFLPNEEPCIEHINGQKNQGRKWSLEAFKPDPKYIGAVAVKGKNLRFIRYEFQTGNTAKPQVIRMESGPKDDIKDESKQHKFAVGENNS